MQSKSKQDKKRKKDIGESPQQEKERMLEYFLSNAFTINSGSSMGITLRRQYLFLDLLLSSSSAGRLFACVLVWH
jgi:hypothetical protein